MEINTTGRSQTRPPPIINASNRTQKRTGTANLKVDQTRKLITQILLKLKKRKKPPSPFQNSAAYVEDGFSEDYYADHNYNDDDGNDINNNNEAFNTDDTYDLLNQLRDVLIVCEMHGINFATPPESPFSSRDPSPNRGRSPSPSRYIQDIPFIKKGSTILNSILEVLYDIVHNDCRYKITSPRPTRPPNALQAITLDVARLLVNQNPYSPVWLYELGMTMLPGFNYFGDVLRSKLLIFYIDFLLEHLVACQYDFIIENSTDEKLNHFDGRLLNENENTSHINITINSDDTITTSNIQYLDVKKSPRIESNNNNNSNKRDSLNRSSKRLSISYTGDLDIDSYYIDSMFTPLLYSMIQFISVENSSLETLYQMHRTLDVMIRHKPDLYHDIIEIIAHGDTPSRNQAINILFHYWGNSTGHPAIGKALPSVGYLDDLMAKENPQTSQSPPTNNRNSSNVIKDVHLHQFLPYIYHDECTKSNNAQPDKHASLTITRHAKIVDMHGQFIPTDHPNACVQCFKPVSKFGLRCSGCKLNVHFTCYNLVDGGFLTEYLLDSGIHKLFTPRFCDISHNPKEFLSDTRVKSNNSKAIIISENLAGHKFHLVNLFTLVLCMICKQPLWGIMHQGYRCEPCNRFTHKSCLKSEKMISQFQCHPTAMSESDALIDYNLLRTSFVNHFKDILISDDAAATFSFEEISVILTILQMQDDILRNGIMAGCLLIKQESHNPLSPRDEQFEQFELQDNIKRHQKYFEKRELSLSKISKEYWSGMGREPHMWLLSCEEYLAHLASIMKTSVDSEIIFASTNDKRSSTKTANTLSSLLPTTTMNSYSQDDNYGSNEIITTDELVQWIQKKLNFHKKFSAKILLQQMANFGFIERIDGHPILFHNAVDGKIEYDCLFPLTFATECSPTVETLITAIYGCLSDINISINECGFLIMTRRCFPDPFLSRYTLERLIFAVIDWSCSEDDRLLKIAREYIPLKRKLPGVRDEMEDKRAGVGGSSTQQKGGTYLHNYSGGGAYIISRKMLKEKYVVNWMSKIHEINPTLFCDLVYNQLESLQKDQNEKGNLQESMENEFHHYDIVLKNIIKLWNNGLLFSSLNNLISLCASKIPSNRQSTTDQILIHAENNNLDITDPIATLSQLFKEGGAVELSRAVQWMELMVRAGVGLPGLVFSDFLPLLAKIEPSLELYTSYLHVIWYQVMNGLGHLMTRGVILKIISDVNEATLDMIKKINEEGQSADMLIARKFIKITLALSLHSYSCPLDYIYNLGIVEEPNERPNGQMLPKRISHLQDPTPGSNVTSDTSLIKCLLIYARLEKLEIRSDVVKSFWRFFTAASLIFNKIEFINSCIPKLLPIVWEELSPLYDASSEITMLLLMRIIWTDSRFFLASVSKVFEHERWEVRFDGLDNLYGLFSKLDEKFELQRTGVFAYLGPVFSYMISLLWDPEEYVRTKTISYIRTMQPKRIKMAFKCWEGYFKVASQREKTVLARLMLKLNAKFPNWQVIEWDVLLDALSHESDESEAVSTVDILESYMRPNSILIIGLKHYHEDSDTTPGQRVAEEKNLKVILLSLALQMLANGIEMNLEQIIKLKYFVAHNLGFIDSRIDNSNGVMSFHFGEFRYVPDDFTQNMMMVSILGNLKRVLDTPIYLNNDKEELEDGKASSENEMLAGGYFIEIVLAMFNSSADMTSLSHLMLKTWIELLLIIVYKHKIENKYNRELEESLVSAMKKLSELLSKDITDENKQLIVELSSSLLKRAPMLTVNVLGKQIITLAKLLTSLKADSSNALVVIGDENNTELNMFKLLGDVIRDEQIPVEDECFGPRYLRDEPIRDVINQLFKFTNRRIVSTILSNLNKYVELVYSKPYSEQLINDLSQFLTKLTRHTSEWKLADWDANPVLNMIAVIMRDNPVYSKNLVAPIKGFLRHSINKGSVRIDTFLKLLAAYTTVSETISPDDKINVFGEVILEEVKSTFRGSRSRMSRDTLIILSQLILWDMQPSSHSWFKSIELKMGVGLNDNTTSNNDGGLSSANVSNQRLPYFSNVVDNLFDDCIQFLENPHVTKQYSKKEFKVGVCASQLAVAMCGLKYDLLTKIFLSQKPTDPRRTIRLLNWILLGIIKSDPSPGLITIITTVFDFQDTLTDLLSHFMSQPFNEIIVPDMNYLYTPSGESVYQAFVFIKIWTVLCAQTSSSNDKTNAAEVTKVHLRLATSLTMAERRFWNIIWPSMNTQLVSRIVDKEVQLAVAMCGLKYDLLTKIFLSQKPTDPRRTIRLLNWILLGIIKSDPSPGLITIITTVFDFQDTLTDLLSHFMSQPFNEIIVPDMNYLYTPSGESVYQAFVFIKIWTVLCAQTSSSNDKTNAAEVTKVHLRLATSLTMAERRFWNIIWPSMNTQLVSRIVDKEVQPNGIVYWEMFMDLITFLHLSGSDIVMLYSHEWATLLDSLIIEDGSKNPEFHHKIKQARSMFDKPPLMMQENDLTTQLFIEMREAMRLYCEINNNSIL
ncbi:13743_t:CDS:10 [Entrophospora sp. SA101]|nr:13743_t:CDS:10 [Entrophospora sp. SA101]